MHLIEWLSDPVHFALVLRLLCEAGRWARLLIKLRASTLRRSARAADSPASTSPRQHNGGRDQA